MHRQESQYGDAGPLRRLPYRRGDGAGQRRGDLQLYTLRFLSQQQEPPSGGAVADAGGRVRRRGARRPRPAAAPAGRGPQDCQRGGGRLLRPASHAGGHPRVPCGKPYRLDRQQQDALADGTRVGEIHSRAVSSQSPPLADTARPLCVPGTQTQMRRVRLDRGVLFL